MKRQKGKDYAVKLYTPKKERTGESGKPENGGTPKAVTGPGTPEETGR